MSDQLLYRASAETAVEGRTLIGVAIPWETPTRVSDFGGPAYLEDFARSSADKTLAQNPDPRPLYDNHGHLRGELPVGITHYSTTPTSLLFRSTVWRSREGDAILDRARSGLPVSVGFRPINSTQLRSDAGTVTRRTEIALRELSLTSKGQIPGARVLAVRSDQLAADVSLMDQQEAVSDAIEHMLFGKDGAPDGVYVFLPFCTDSYAVYGVEGGALDKPELNDTWRVDYVISPDGTVTLSAPSRVKQEWVAVEAARSATDTPRLDRWLRTRGKSSPASRYGALPADQGTEPRK